MVDRRRVMYINTVEASVVTTEKLRKNLLRRDYRNIKDVGFNLQATENSLNNFEGNQM